MIAWWWIIPAFAAGIIVGAFALGWWLAPPGELDLPGPDIT